MWLCAYVCVYVCERESVCMWVSKHVYKWLSLNKQTNKNENENILLILFGYNRSSVNLPRSQGKLPIIT